LNDFARRVKNNLDIEIGFDNSVVDYLVKAGYDPKFGARPMKRALQRYIENKIAEYIIKGEIKKNSKIKLSFYDDKLVVN